MSLEPEKVAEREKKLREALLLLAALYLNAFMDYEEYLEVSEYVLVNQFAETVSEVNVGLVAQGFQPIDPSELKEILDESLADFREEAASLYDNPADSEARMGLTVWSLEWRTSNTMIREAAEQSGATYIEWNTQWDSSVCEICLSLAGVYEINESLPDLPQHPSCRCF